MYVTRVGATSRWAPFSDILRLNIIYLVGSYAVINIYRGVSVAQASRVFYLLGALGALQACLDLRPSAVNKPVTWLSILILREFCCNEASAGPSRVRASRVRVYLIKLLSHGIFCAIIVVTVVKIPPSLAFRIANFTIEAEIRRICYIRPRGYRYDVPATI